MASSPNPDVSTPGIAARGLCRRFGTRWALIDVSLEVPGGGALLLAGRNGSGKTTLLRILATAIRADRGTAQIAGYPVATERDTVRRNVALLSHQNYLYEALTALENLQVAARFLGRPASRDFLLPLLERVQLAERADDPAATFSAGMRKRLALARTLLQEARVILLDEPYGQLDPPGFELIDRLVRGFRSQGTTVVLSTHQIERGSALCDQGLVLDAGRPVWTGSAADLPRRGPFRTSTSAEGAC